MSDPAKSADNLLRLAEVICDETATTDEFAQLDALLAGDEDARRTYLDYCELHFAIGLDLQAHWEGQKACRQLRQLDCTDGPCDSVAVPEGKVPTSPMTGSPGVTFLGSAVNGAGSYLASGWPMAYLVATVILGVGLLVGTITHISPLSQTAGINSPAAAPEHPATTKSPSVGRITGLVNVRWNDPSAAVNCNAEVALGCRYALASGLMEITYDTGAKVILQGPVTYDVNSTAGGYLSSGKLTARLKSKAEEQSIGGQWWVAKSDNLHSPIYGKADGGENGSQQNSDDHPRSGPTVTLAQRDGGRDSSPPFPVPSPFTVTTPTAIVTDIGTEFAIEVRGPSSTDTHVFCGVVEVQVRDGGAAPPIRLTESESLRVKAEKGQVAVVSREAVDGDGFVRRLPSQGKRVPIAIHGTGMAAEQWGRDPHWTIVRASNDPRFLPRPASVVQNVPQEWLANAAGRSQWISTVLDGSPVPNNVTYTFRTTFDLTGRDSETGAITGWFIADSYIRAMRLNGRELVVPKHRHDPRCDLFTRLAISDGFVDGTNVLEVDVENAEPNGTGGASPMGLRMELKATARIAP